jgi:hypothetical protein
MSDAPPRPYPEARPPHAPDVLTRQSPWMYAFALVAAILVWLAWREVQLSEPELVDYPSFAALVITTAVFPLIGAVLFIRRPDARRTMPLLVFGLGLLSAVELLDALDTPIYEALAGPDQAFDAPTVIAYGVFVSLARLFGIVYLGVGIASTRTLPPARAERPLAVWLATLAVVGVVGGAVALGPPSTSDGAVDVVGSVIGLALGLGATLAWAYVAWVTVGGAMAGEVPQRAWRLGAIAFSILFAFRVFSGVFVVFGPNAQGVGLVAIVVSLGDWVILVVAFALGLPTPAEAVEAQVTTTADPPAVTQPGSARD